MSKRGECEVVNAPNLRSLETNGHFGRSQRGIDSSALLRKTCEGHAAAPGSIKFGAQAGGAKPWLPTQHSKVPFDGPMERINLLDEINITRWKVRDQADTPTCTAHAAIACIELMLAREPAGPTWLSVRFVDEALRARRPFPGSESNAPAGIVIPRSAAMAKLCEAAITLETDGICLESYFDETAVPKGQQPDVIAKKDAADRKYRAAFYRDYPPPGEREADLARWVYSELKSERPVAIALPGFHEPADLLGRTSWDRDSIWLSGVVTDPQSPHDNGVPGSGHAICVVGFEPQSTDPLDGHFIFRNSWGAAFGKNLNIVLSGTSGPLVPMRGYGKISANYVEKYCWEAVSFIRMGN